MAHRCVWSRNLENEQAEVRYGAVEKYNQKGFNAKKTNKYSYDEVKTVNANSS
jgi:hypothetical protein